MVDLLSSIIMFLRPILVELAWIFLNSTFLLRSYNTCFSTTPIGVVTPKILKESSGSILNFLGPVNNIGLLWNWKWLFPLLYLLSELVRQDSSSPNSSIFASNVLKVFFTFLFSLLISDLLDLLDRLALELSSSIFCFLTSLLLPSVQWDAVWPYFSHLKLFFFR